MSVRSYQETLSTLYRGRFNDGAVTGVELVGGVSRRKPGIVMFDAEIAADGRTLFVVDGLTFQYRGEIKGVNTPVLEGVPSLDREGNLFFVSVRSYINTNGLEYAPAVSNDLLELFFTRIPVASGPPQPVPIQE